MILKTLELSGFKSFANPTRLDFSYPIVAIVGPNGSGKSNVAEAFRFVLGEQSKKNLRSKSAEDLIWAGNEYKPKQNRARVSITFDNKDGLFGVEFEELKIERVVYRDGANEYFINDSPARLKDILYVLSSAKLGASSHHIISQGEADALLNAGPKERLQIIKDALGLNKYIIKLQEARRKLEKTENNIKEVNIKIRELKPQLTFLESQIEKQKQIDILREELKKAYAYYIYLKEAEIKAEKQRVINQLHQLKLEYEAAKEALDSVQASFSKDNNVLKRLELKEEEKNQLLRKISELKQLLSASQAKKDALLNLQKQLQHSAPKRKDVYRVPRKLLEDLLEFLEELQSKDKLSIMDAASKLIKNIKNILEESDEKDSTSFNINQEELVVLDKQIQDISIKLQELENKDRELLSEIEELKMIRRQQEAQNQKREAKLIELTERRAKKMNEYRNKELELVKLKNQEESLRSLISEAQLKLGAEFLSFFAELKSGKRKVESKVDRSHIERLKYKLESLGTVDPSVIQEYKNLQERINFLVSELEDTHKSKKDTEELISELNSKLEKELHKGLKNVSDEFARFFKILFGGGTASLKLRQAKNKDGETEEYLEIDLNIPGKKLSSLESLSGGERSLVSIALIFAISQVSPPPFIILDETDAALDEANSRRYSEILLSLSQNSQLITITHNRQTMSVAGELYGVTMGKDAVSQVLSITLEEAKQVAK